MACGLQRDGSLKHDFTSKAGTAVTVKASAESGNAGIASALFNGSKLTIQADGSIQFTIVAGLNLVNLGILAPPNDIVRVLEDCGGGETQVLEKFKNTPDPETGVPDPLTGFSVFAFD